jgi:eukaryotic-like serine/threonine-protein kinase
MPPPQRIGRYRVERILGTGAFGVVWLAYDDRLHAPVAVKVMAENWAYRMDVRERFLTEARLLRKTNSPRVVQVYDIGEPGDDRPYFVMEYAEHGSVEERLADGPLPLPEALRITAEAARGVSALHGTGVVHRDLKPSNLLLAGGGPNGPERVLVADLGLAKNLAQASGLTVVAGSAGYMPPEQQDGLGGVDERSDVYSLGAVLYHLVTGAVPDRPGAVRAPSVLRPDLSAGVERAVLRAMDPDREGRWPSAEAFAAELDRLADTSGDGPVDPPAAEPVAPRPRWRRRGAVVAGTAAVVLLAAGATAEWLHQPSSAPKTQQVHDATGRISVTVPGAWATQVTDGGWSPFSLGLPAAHAPGLIVAQDADNWSNLTRPDDGVFVGVTGSDRLRDVVADVRHDGCTKGDARTYAGARWHGRIREWSCGPGGHLLEEAALAPADTDLPHAYVQVRCDDDCAAHTDKVLRSLRVKTGP